MVGHSDSIDRQGMHIAASAFEAIGLAFREQPTSDFGIDAHVEPRSGSRGTGKLIALQIKSGTSYFREAGPDGWWLRTDQTHAEYWLQHALAVVIVQVDVQEGRAFWEVVTDRTVQFTDLGAKILIRRDHRVDESFLPAFRELLLPVRDLVPPEAEGADCRVFLGRGVSGRDGWQAFARILVSELVRVECVTGWDIVIDVRTAIEDDDLAGKNEYGELGEDLVSLDVNAARRVATYSVSSREVDAMNLLWDEDRRAQATADAIIERLMGEEGLLDYEDDDENDEAP